MSEGNNSLFTNILRYVEGTFKKYVLENKSLRNFSCDLSNDLKNLFHI